MNSNNRINKVKNYKKNLPSPNNKELNKSMNKKLNKRNHHKGVIIKTKEY